MNEQEFEYEITITVFAKNSTEKTAYKQIEKLIDDFNTVLYKQHPEIESDCFSVAEIKHI
jgi:hypothetical protein